MHAHDRFLPEWFNRIRSRQITLPRFQAICCLGARRGLRAPDRHCPPRSAFAAQR